MPRAAPDAIHPVPLPLPFPESPLPAPNSPFALAVTQVGSELWLKDEMLRLRPELRPSYQRPGLITFKSAGAPFEPTDAPDAIFARMWACAKGPVRESAEILDIAAQVKATRLWVSPRDQGPPQDTPQALIQAAEAHAEALRQELAPRFREGNPAHGETILDLITSPGDPTVVGWHTHAPTRHGRPGGRFDLPVLPQAPSRGWSKVSEAILWAGIHLTSQDTVLEIGASPGGATYAFLGAGAKVIAVDPQPLERSLNGHPRLTTFKAEIGELRWEDLPLKGVTWIACDANLLPEEAVFAVRRFVGPTRSTLRGLLLTLKLPDQGAVDSLPQALDNIRSLGVRELRARQLPSNRRDIMVVARFAVSSAAAAPRKPRVYRANKVKG